MAQVKEPNLIECLKCGHKIEANSEFCYYCGETFSEATDDKPYTPILPHVSETKCDDLEHFADDVPEDEKSFVAKMIKIISIIVLILSVIGSFVIMKDSLAFGVASLIVSILFSLLSYGIGEIIDLLFSMNAKMNYPSHK